MNEDPKYIADDIVSDLRPHIENMLKERGISAYSSIIVKILVECNLSFYLESYIKGQYAADAVECS